MSKNTKNYLLDNGWKISMQKKSAKKKFIFKDFKAAFSWMTFLAIVAEKYNHHPEWKNIYNKIEVTLTTHDTGSLSEKDVKLAKVMDYEFQRYNIQNN